MKFVIVSFLVLTAISSYARPSQEDREEHRAAFESCAQELGIEKPERGQRPSLEEREKMDACLASKGIERPEHPPHGARHGDRDQDDV